MAVNCESQATGLRFQVTWDVCQAGDEWHIKRHDSILVFTRGLKNLPQCSYVVLCVSNLWRSVWNSFWDGDAGIYSGDSEKQQRIHKFVLDFGLFRRQNVNNFSTKRNFFPFQIGNENITLVVCLGEHHFIIAWVLFSAFWQADSDKQWTDLRVTAVFTSVVSEGETWPLGLKEDWL